MNPENFEQLEEGYESALDSVSEFADVLSDLQDTLTDSLADLHGDICALTVTLRGCLNSLQNLAANYPH